MKNCFKSYLLLFCATFFTLSAQAQRWGKINGEGPLIKKELKVDDFNKLGLAVGGRIYLSKGNTQKVEVEGQENIINNIETDVDNGKWSIEFDQKVRDYKQLTFYITVPEITGLSIAGSGKITTNDTFDKTSKMDMSIAGAGTIEFNGSTSELKVSIAGSGTVKAEDLKAENCKVSIAGSGDSYVHVDGQLKVSIAGSGDVRYKGSPSVKSSIAGSGNISSL